MDEAAGQLNLIQDHIALGQPGPALDLCDSLIADSDALDGDAALVASVMRMREVALSQLGRNEDGDRQVAEIQRRFADCDDPEARLTAAQALLDRVLWLLVDELDLAAAIRESSRVLERLRVEPNEQVVMAMGNELLGAARYFVWSDPVMQGSTAGWLAAVLGRGLRRPVRNGVARFAGVIRSPKSEELRTAPRSPDRLEQAALITDSVLQRCRSDGELVAFALLRRSSVLFLQGRPRKAIRTLAAFRRLGEPAVASVVERAAPAQGGGYRDVPRMAAMFGAFLDVRDGPRSAATDAAIKRILAAEAPRSLPALVLRWRRAS